MDKINELKSKYIKMEDDEHFISYSVLVELLDDLESFRHEPKTHKDELLLELGKYIFEMEHFGSYDIIPYYERDYDIAKTIADEIFNRIEKIKHIKSEE